MNKEETKRAIEVQQAFVDGANVQSRLIGRVEGTSDGWFRDISPLWNWATYDYRIEPVPREFWLGRYPASNYGWTVYDGEGPPTSMHNEWIKVREVLDES